MPLTTVGLPVVQEEETPRPRKRVRVTFPAPHPGRDISPKRTAQPPVAAGASPTPRNHQHPVDELRQLLDLCERAVKAAERVSMSLPI